MVVEQRQAWQLEQKRGWGVSCLESSPKQRDSELGLGQSLELPELTSRDTLPPVRRCLLTLPRECQQLGTIEDNFIQTNTSTVSEEYYRFPGDWTGWGEGERRTDLETNFLALTQSKFLKSRVCTSLYNMIYNVKEAARSHQFHVV